MPPVMFSMVTKYHKGRHSLFLYNSEIFYAFTQDILRSPTTPVVSTNHAIGHGLATHVLKLASKSLPAKTIASLTGISTN